jgi:hypothetical protein
MSDTLAADVRPDGTVSNASGVVLPVISHTTFRNGRGNGEQHAYRVRTPDGREWHGRNGGPGLPITLRAVKPRRDGRTEVAGVVTDVQRLGTSFYGNPTYAITIQHEDGTTTTYRTQTDSGAGYSARNYEPRHGIRPTVTLGLTRSGRVFGISGADVWQLREAGATA